MILLKIYIDSNRFRGELWKRDDSGAPACTWSRDIYPADTTPISMAIELADLYDNEIPTFLEGTGPIILDLQKLASQARRSLAKMKTDDLKRKRSDTADPSDTVDPSRKKVRGG